MTITQEPRELTRNNSERLSPLGWSEASKMVRNFTTEPAFLESLGREGVSPTDPTTLEYANALSSYSEGFYSAYELDNTTDPNQSTQIRLIASAPRLIHSMEEITFYLNEAKQRNLSTDEKTYQNSFKPFLVWYNQLLSGYDLANPTGKMSEMAKALTEQSLLSFPYDGQGVENNTKMIMRGARTEAASQQLLSRTKLNYSPGTAQDDMRGGDVIILHKGLRIKVDLKSSLEKIAAIRGGYDKIIKEKICYAISKKPGNHGNKEAHVIVLFPGFTDSDFGNSLGLQLSETDMQSRADNIEKQIHLALRELQL